MPTDGTPVAARIKDELSRVQVETLERNCAEFGIPIYSLGSEHQGIVHVIGPELGVTQPGMTIVCGDSHTATHGAFGALAFGIGTSEVEHVLATQCLVQPKPKAMRIRYEGDAGAGVTAKDLILATIGQMGVDGAAGHVVEFAGPAIEALSMEGRMTICNMTIEGGGRAGMVAPDDTTFAWVEERGVRGRPRAWRELRTDDGATLRQRGRRRRERDQPDGHAGARTRRRSSASPTRCPSRRTEGERARAGVHGPARPERRSRRSSSTASSSARARTRGSATCARPREVVEGRKVAGDVYAMVVPGSRAGEARRPSARASTRSSGPPASTGAARAARCAWG